MGFIHASHYLFKLYNSAKQSYLLFAHTCPLSCLDSFGQAISFLCEIFVTTSSSGKISFILQSSFQMLSILEAVPAYPYLLSLC